MKARFVLVVSAAAATFLMATSCAPAAPAPVATQPAAQAQKPAEKAPAEPTRVSAPPAAVVQPTAPATQPTAARKASYPEKGKSITVIVPYPAGGGVDVAGRLLAAPMEKVLGVPLVIVNKAGAGTQVGNTDLAMAKPDGYTSGVRRPVGQPGEGVGSADRPGQEKLIPLIPSIHICGVAGSSPSSPTSCALRRLTETRIPT